MIKRLFLVILIFLAVSVPAIAEDASDILVKFGQVSDVHLSYTKRENSRRLFEHSEALLKDCISQLNSIKGIDFVIFTGDMVDSAGVSNLKKFIIVADTLNSPWYASLGNHDVPVTKGSSSKPALLDLFRSKTKSMHNGRPYYSFYPNDKSMVIVLDATTDQKVTCNGVVSPAQMSWLKNQLENNKDRVIIIALHHPIVPPFKGSDHRIVEPVRTELNNLIDQYANVALVISGHYHTTKIQKQGKIIHASAPSLIEYPNAFRVITIMDNGDIEFEWKDITDKKLQELSKSRSKWAATSYGSAKDRKILLNYKQ